MTQTHDPALRHGGALDAAIARFGGVRADWLDLSTGINPLPPSLPPVPADAWTRLPEREAEDRLIAAARSAYGAGKEAAIVAGPGSQALISNLPFCLSPSKVAILSPTYSEHGLAFAAAGHDVLRISFLDALPGDAATVVVVNPNNPDGRHIAPADLLSLAERLAGRGGLLVVDEAFVDAEPHWSVAASAGMPGLLIHRSFGKVYGLAGLRLGFALTTCELAGRLSERLGPWAVSGPALAIGTAILEDGGLRKRLSRQLNANADRLKSLLQTAGLEIVGRTALFVTIRHANAYRLHAALCGHHILTRPFDHSPDWLRFGLPGADADWDRLGEALAKILRLG
ncbi:MAG: threonine-phosphate decarboxylase [Fulvimarina manganoxydans]|uniref:threonine-phosphate decarboxylase CobD n=1 Tax=Fulvimarina manganoxydans TaxID=937218 RepID=UPI002352FC49|nr:threonine-phosphate decarboxylase CobD [Fulvimarina manganoxydans]MCK5934766.1 threonine-phosphate decarboxylase [Fulvimarina manganoxydans]